MKPEVVDQQRFENLAALIKRNKIKIESRRFENKTFLKSLWLKFCYAYARFRAVRDCEFFENAYKSEIIRLRIGDRVIQYPTPWQDVCNVQS